MSVSENHRLKVVELCAGGGGLSLGIKNAGLDVDLAVEIDPDMAAIYQANHRDTHLISGAQGDIRNLKPRSISNLVKKIDILAAGLPCQGFSLNGKRDINDPRNGLWIEVIRIAKSVRPSTIVIENVPAMKSFDEGRVFEQFVERLEHHGYKVTSIVLDASKFFVPQRRRRLFLIASLHTQGISFPENSDEISVWDSIGDLPEQSPSDSRRNSRLPYRKPPLSSYASRLRKRHKSVSNCSVTLHNKELISRFQKLRPGERDGPTRHRRLEPQKPAPTLLAGAKTITACRPIHPFKDRVITVREGARISGFPDSYWFPDQIQKSWYAIGNSVPPPLAEVVFRQIRHELFK